MKGITFPAWHGKHYVTLAEVVVRLGSFGLDLTRHIQCAEIVDPRCVERERRSADAGMDTLTLLSLTTPFLQLIDAEARGFAEGELVLVLTEFDIPHGASGLSTSAYSATFAATTRVPVTSERGGTRLTEPSADRRHGGRPVEDRRPLVEACGEGSEVLERSPRPMSHGTIHRRNITRPVGHERPPTPPVSRPVAAGVALGRRLGVCRG